MKARRVVLGSLAALLMFAAPSSAIEQWGRVKSVNVRFHHITVVQDGNEKEYLIRINSDTVFVLLDGRVVQDLDVRSLDRKRVYALVEENPEHYATKIWLRPDVTPENDPVNPGVGATKRGPRGRSR